MDRIDSIPQEIWNEAHFGLRLTLCVGCVYFAGLVFGRFPAYPEVLSQFPTKFSIIDSIFRPNFRCSLGSCYFALVISSNLINSFLTHLNTPLTPYNHVDQTPHFKSIKMLQYGIQALWPMLTFVYHVRWVGGLKILI